MINVFEKQLDDLKEIVPNFYVANATCHFDEHSPHLHIVGVPVKENCKTGLSKQVGKTSIFTKESLVIIQDKMREKCIEEFNNIYESDSKLKEKQKGKNHLNILIKIKRLFTNSSIDPVVLFKLVFIQTLDGIKSMRKTCEKIKVDAEYRWFLNIPFGYDTPHFSTFSKTYERRFKDSEIFENIFINIVNQAIKYNLIDGTTFYTDSTHKKANANKGKYNDTVEEVAKTRRIWLEEEINEERRKQNKKEFKYEDEIINKDVRISTTDPESGYYHRDNKEKGFMYLDHRTVDDKCNIIVDCYVTKGNVHDSNPYIERMEYLKRIFSFNIQKVALDSGYATLDIKKYIIDNNILGVIGYRRYGSKESRSEKNKYYYNEEYDVYVEKETGEVLEYKGKIDRLGYKTYINTTKDKIVRRHICEYMNELIREYRISEEGKELYKKRKEKVERSFADSKQNHGYRYAMYKGLKKNQHYTWLICAAQNMKNISMKIENRQYEDSKTNHIRQFLVKFIKKLRKFFQTKTSVIKNWG